MKESSAQQYNRMTKTPVPKLLLTLAVPAIITMLITNIYNLADTAFVSMLGDSASGAVGIVFGFMSILQAVSFMFGQGGGSTMARLLGARRTDAANTAVSTAFFSAVGFGLIVAVLGSIFVRPLVMLFGSTETIAPYAITYIRFILIAAPFICPSFVMNNILRYEGKAALGTLGMISGALLNIGLDALLMLVFHMGIAGAGLATAFSQFVGFCILLSMFLRGRSTTKLSLGSFTRSAKEFGSICATGAPSLIRNGLAALSTTILNYCSAPYGDAAIAAMSIVSRISFLIFAVCIGVGQGFQPIASFNYGAGKYSRVRSASAAMFVGGQILLTLLAVPAILFPETLVGLFRDSAPVIAYGARALRLQGIALLLMPITVVSEMLFQSTGHKGGAAIMSSVKNGLFFIPLLLILSSLRGMSGVQEAQPLAYLLSIIPSVILLYIFMKRMPKEDLPDPE